jgi:octaprenyl-diphosphate synthase
MTQVPEAGRQEQTPLSLDDIFADVQEDILEVDRLIRDKMESDVEMVETMGHYIHESGGKRIRPAVLLLAAKLCGSVGLEAQRYAAVMEIVHTATLVHDDIVDQATLRRGQTSINSLLGNEVTVLLGDYLYIRSMGSAIEMGNLEILRVICEITLKMIEGMILELTRGGAIDLTEEEHLDILRRKTAFFFSGCTKVGGIVAGADEEHRDALASYGMNFGMAFQVVDDLLDFTATEDVLGKPVLQDLKEGHVTLPIIYALQAEPGVTDTVEAIIKSQSIDEASLKEILDLMRRHRVLDAAREVAESFSSRAKKDLESLPDNPHKASLIALTDYVIERNR